MPRSEGNDAFDSSFRPTRFVMPRTLSFAALIAAVLAVAGVAALWLTRPDVAYIDSSRLMQRYDGAIAVRQQMQDRQRDWRRNVQTLQAETSELGTRVTEASLTRAQRTAVRDSFQAKQRQLARYQRAVQKKSQELQQELMQPVYDQLNADIQRFGEDTGHDIILGTVAGGNILYARDGTDVTEAFLQFIGNTGQPKAVSSPQTGTTPDAKSPDAKSPAESASVDTATTAMR